MRFTALFIFTMALICVSQPIRAQSPVGVSAPELSLRNSVIEIVYDILNSSVTDKFTIRIEVSDANGRNIQARSLTGDIGEHIDGGGNKKIFWDIGTDSIFLDEEIFVQVYALAESSPITVQPVVQEAAKAEDRVSVTTLQDQSSEIPDPLNGHLTEASENKSFNRAGVILQSMALPGLGLSRIHPGKPHWIKGAMGYGCIAGSLYLNRRAVTSYSSYQETGSLDEVDILFKQAERQDAGSEVLAYAAIGIWVTDLIWNILGTSDLNRAQLSCGSGSFSIGASVEPASSVPLLALKYKF